MADTPSASSMSARFSLEAMINGLAGDLKDLRAGKISVEDARVRAELAKQFLNGVRLVVSAQKFIAQSAKRIGAAKAGKAES